MPKMKGNMRRVGPQIPGAPDASPPKAIQGKFDRLENGEETYYDGQLRPGPRLSRPRKRGKRISKMRTGNDAAMALSRAMEKHREGKSSGAGYSGKSDEAFLESIGVK